MNAGWFLSVALSAVCLILAVMVLSSPMARTHPTPALDYEERYEEYGFKFVCEAHTSDPSVAEELETPPPVGWKMVTVCETVAL